MNFKTTSYMSKNLQTNMAYQTKEGTDHGNVKNHNLRFKKLKCRDQRIEMQKQ